MEKSFVELELHQKLNLTDFKNFKLLPDGVHCVRAHNDKRIEYKVLFEDITDKPLKVTYRLSSKATLILGIILSVIPFFILFGNSPKTSAMVFGLVLGVIGLATIYMYWSSKTDFLLFTSNTRYELAIVENNPSKKEVDRFLETMHEARVEFLKAKYGTISTEASLADELAKFHYLKEQGAISEDEYVKLKNDLLKDINSENRQTGFSM